MGRPQTTRCDEIAVDRNGGVGAKFGVPVRAGGPHLVFDPGRELPAVGHQALFVDDRLLPCVLDPGHVPILDQEPALGTARERENPTA